MASRMIIYPPNAGAKLRGGLARPWRCQGLDPAGLNPDARGVTGLPDSLSALLYGRHTHR
ncbi:MAG: hypothetical protein ACYSW8_28535 [Planctomycetota bacterium]